MKNLTLLLMMFISYSIVAADQTQYCDQWLDDITNSCESISGGCDLVTKCMDIRSKCNQVLVEKYYGANKFREKSCKTFKSCVESQTQSGCEYEWSDYKCTATGLGIKYSKCPGRVSLLSFFTDSYTVSDSWFDCDGQKKYFKTHVKDCVSLLDKSSETIKICDLKKYQDKIAKVKKLVAFNKQVEADQMKIPKDKRQMREFYKYDRFAKKYNCQSYFQKVKLEKHDDSGEDSTRSRSTGKDIDQHLDNKTHSIKTKSY